MKTDNKQLIRSKTLLAATAKTQKSTQLSIPSLINDSIEKLCFWLLLSTYAIPLCRDRLSKSKA